MNRKLHKRQQAKNANFPVITADGEVLPALETVRDHTLRFSNPDRPKMEVLDPRPVAASVAFAPDQSPMELVTNMIAQAEQRMLERLNMAGKSGTEFYPTDLDEDIDSIEACSTDGFYSPYEETEVTIQGNPVAVPRAFAQALKAENKAAKRGKAPAATPAPTAEPSPAPAPSNEEASPPPA